MDTTSPWSSVFTFRTVDPEPDEVLLTFPSNNATNAEHNLTLRWKVSSRASRYFLQVSMDSNFIDIVVTNPNVLENTFDVSLEADVRYFWRVRAGNSFGASSWSQVWSFVTKPIAPIAPELLYPASEETDIPINASLIWSNIQNATEYVLNISQDNSFIFMEIDITTSETRWRATLSRNTKYYWRVRAINKSILGEWSVPFSFTTGTEMSSGAFAKLADVSINYVRGALYITTNELSLKNRSCEVSIFDNNGNMLLNINKVLENQSSLQDLDYLTSGVYHCKLTFVDGSSYLDKFIVVK